MRSWSARAAAGDGDPPVGHPLHIEHRSRGSLGHLMGRAGRAPNAARRSAAHARPVVTHARVKCVRRHASRHEVVRVRRSASHAALVAPSPRAAARRSAWRWRSLLRITLLRVRSTRQSCAHSSGMWRGVRVSGAPVQPASPKRRVECMARGEDHDSVAIPSIVARRQCDLTSPGRLSRSSGTWRLSGRAGCNRSRARPDCERASALRHHQQFHSSRSCSLTVWTLRARASARTAREHGMRAQREGGRKQWQISRASAAQCRRREIGTARCTRYMKIRLS